MSLADRQVRYMAGAALARAASLLESTPSRFERSADNQDARFIVRNSGTDNITGQPFYFVVAVLISESAESSQAVYDSWKPDSA